MRSPPTKATAPLLAAWCAALSGCWQRAEAPAPLVVERTSPALGDPARPLLLNDALTVYFSAALRPLSITPDSVTLLDEQGHQVPGRLESGENWVTFLPAPPLSPELDDGSLRPGGRYRLQLAGHPRPDSIRAADGRWLDAAVTFDVFVADRDHVVEGLPSILRPTTSEVPFLMRRPEAPLPVAADEPRLLVHFTQPLLPGSVRAEAFSVQVLGSKVELRPQRVEVFTSPLDEHPGSSVEVYLGGLPRFADGTQRALEAGDWISVAVRPGGGLTDYGGRAPLPATPVIWSVIAGSSVPICDWLSAGQAESAPFQLAPGFEAREARLRPRLRVEAGSGALGRFAPTRDVTLRAGAPFDRGDGERVVSEGPVFAFTSVEIPDGVTVTVDARAAPVRLCATGGVRIAGQLRLRAPTVEVPRERFGAQPVAGLAEVAPVSVLAGGAVRVDGAVTHEESAQSDRSALLLAGAGGLQLYGPIPYRTMLGVDAQAGPTRGALDGAKGQGLVVPVTFTRGLPADSAVDVTHVLPWRQVPLHCDGGRLQVEGALEGLRLEWQSTAADPILGSVPDVAVGRVGRWQPARAGDALFAAPGSFLRLRLRATARADAASPEVTRLRLVEAR
ncbi:MAG: hypothetical protein ACON4Z_01600 [Planctomycetota bacterium]